MKGKTLLLSAMLGLVIMSPALISAQLSISSVSAVEYISVFENLDTENLKVGEVITLGHVQFAADEAILESKSYSELDEALIFLTSNPNITIEVGGHTNSIPPHKYCNELSDQRAKAVAEYLISKGIDEGRISYKGYGKTQPATNNNSTEGRAANQRVQLKITSLR